MKKPLKYITLAALFAALTAVATAFIKFNTGINDGYLHFGDAVIYLAASLLPAPYAAAAAGIGGAFADLLAGAPMWALPTMVIKALISLPFTSKDPGKIITLRNVLVTIPAAAITIGGYYIFESLLYGSWVGAAASIPFSIIQSAGSAVLYLLIGFTLDKAKLKSRLERMM